MKEFREIPPETVPGPSRHLEQPGSRSVAADTTIAVTQRSAPHLTPDLATSAMLHGRSAELSASALVSMAWTTAEVVAMHLTPLGAIAVRTAYLGRQLFVMGAGRASGDGFDLSVTVPGLTSVLPPELELVARAHVADLEPSGFDLGLEIQIFKPWMQFVDVVRGSGELGGPPHAETPPDGPEDPWRAWMDLLRDALIRNLARGLVRGTGAHALTIEGGSRPLPRRRSSG